MPSPHIKTSSPASDGSKNILWPKKVENYFRKGGKKKNPNLTEEKLEEFNKINEILYEHRRSFSGKSPYYRGLTDSSLVLSRQKRDSDVASNASSSISSFVVKMQELSSSCFSPHRVEKKVVKTNDTVAPLGKRRSALTTLAKEMGLEGKSTSVNTSISKNFLLLEKKPLRERDSNTRSPLPLLPKPSPSPRVSPSSTEEQIAKKPPPTPTNFTQPVSTPPSLSSVKQPQYSQPTIMSISSPPTTPPEPEPKTPSSPPQTLVTPRSKNSQGSPDNRTKKEGTSNLTQEKVYVLADRYRPAALDDFICNKDKARELKNMAKSVDCGHFIFEGPTGVGKRTMIWALLREAFGADRVQTREEVKRFVLQDEAVGSIKVTVKMSMQHVEVSLSEVKGYEKHVIVELIQETITLLYKKDLQHNKENCRVIILYEADKLSTDDLLYLKWQLQRHQGCGKVFFCCTNASKLQPIMSLCNVVKLLPPSNEEIIEVLEFIAEQEGIELPHKLAVRIANNAKNNLRQAIRSFEATSYNSCTLKEDQIILTGWEDDIINIAKSIVEEQSPRQLYNVRGKLQNIIEHNVCPEFIFEGLVKELKNCSVEEFHPQIDSLYKKYKNIAPHRHPAKKNLHQFMTIEEFIAKFMSCYKTTIKNIGK